MLCVHSREGLFIDMAGTAKHVSKEHVSGAMWWLIRMDFMTEYGD